ncbi:MAG: hypothetical protein ACOYVG_06620 [Bacteroidota bacterium]
MKLSKSRQLLWLAIVLPILSLAQEAGDEKQTKNEFSASFNYQSALHFFGRTDSLRSSGLFPLLGFQLKSGLYAQGNFIFVQNSMQSAAYTGATLEAGYRFPETDHFSGNLFFSRFLYKDESTLVQSALRSQTGANLSYLNKILNLNSGLNLIFSDKTDVNASLGVDHLFIFTKGMNNAAIALAPSFTANLGTQQFSNTYLERKNVLGIPVTQQTTENITQFNILSYEIAMPVVFVKGKCNLAFTPSYVMPQNLVTVAGRPDLSERGKNMFYITLSAGIRL